MWSGLGERKVIFSRKFGAKKHKNKLSDHNNVTEIEQLLLVTITNIY